MALVQVVALLLVANTAYGHILLPNLATICHDNNWSTGNHPHPTNCHKFIACSSGVTNEMDCPSLLAFNAAINACDDPVNVPACSGWTGGYYCYHYHYYYHDHHHHVQSPNPNTVCKDLSLSEGIHPHPTDCGKFIQCASQTTFAMDCPAGLHFHIGKKTCEYVKNVDCKNNHDYFATIILG